MGTEMTVKARLEAARSIRRKLRALSQEAQKAELDFVAYLIGMTLVELDDIIATATKR
jgi:hypothetical protein